MLGVLRGLHELAVEAARRGDYEYARMLTILTRRITERTRVRPPREVKRLVCRNCGVPLIPGVTARVRLRGQGGLSYVVVTCTVCGWLHRYPYKTRRRGGGGGK